MHPDENTGYDDDPYSEVNPVLDIPEGQYSEVTLVPGADTNQVQGISFDLDGRDKTTDPPPDEAFGYLINKKWYRKLRGIFLVSTHPRIHGRILRSQYGVYQERARHLASYPWTIHPYSAFRWCWDIIMTMILVETLVATPILISFYHERLHDAFSVVVSTVTASIFFIDILLNFRTGYVTTRTDMVCLHGRQIFWHYLKSWFIIDVVSTMPYHVLYVTFGPEHGHDHLDLKPRLDVKNMVRLLELLKILRMVRVIRYFTRIQEAYKVNSQYIRVINLHIIILFTLHWISCIHYLIADLYHPAGYRNGTHSWVERVKLWDKPVWEKYIHSVIRGLSNMACLGYGTEVPKTSEDIICTIFSIMVGATFFALFVGNLSSILINVDVSQKKYAEVLTQIMEYMRFKQVPKELQKRVVLYYEYKYRRNFFNEYSILNSVSDVLRRELQMFNCRHLVEEVPLFHGLPVTILQNIVGRLEFEVYLPCDVIIGAHTLGDCMYFIEHGTVDIITVNGKTAAHLRDGDFFGEMALITNERRNATVMAKTYCDLYRLNREDFEDAILGYPEVYNQLVKAAEERISKATGKPFHLDVADFDGNSKANRKQKTQTKHNPGTVSDD